MRRVFQAAMAIVVIGACRPLPILAPAAVPGGCHPNEHQCANSNCCLEHWTCGGLQPDLPVTCPEGQCCYEEDTVLTYGARLHQRSPQRRP